MNETVTIANAKGKMNVGVSGTQRHFWNESLQS
jgi:hypothetical protein